MLRDENLKGDSFCFVHCAEGIGGRLRDELRGCESVVVSEHAGTVMLTCLGIAGMGELIKIATVVNDAESCGGQFLSKLRRALVERIG